MDGDQGPESKAALRDRHEGWQSIRNGGHLGNWKNPNSGEWIRTFAILTTDANELVASIHDRMPLILNSRDYSRWLSEEPDPSDLMRRFPADPMRMWPISTRINKPENSEPSLIEPIEFSMAGV
jgi:putative SOS response-associated peptidase YedK